MGRLDRSRDYQQLINDITALYHQARMALVSAYWEIGKRIVEQEQQGQEKADYGTQLLDQLSHDLCEKLGAGFSVCNLRNMRRFYLEYPIQQPAVELTWSQHVELMAVTDTATRKQLQDRTLRENLSRRQVRLMVRQNRKDVSARVSARSPGVPTTLPCQRGTLQQFSWVAPDRASCAKGCVVIDCGFNLWQTVPRNQVQPVENPSYTYPARVESVVDGDTLWALIDCTRGIVTRQKLRFHNIDAPELGTPAGDKAKRFVKRVLKSNPEIVIQTHKYDKYTRYLADIFYLPGSRNANLIIKEGIYLNQQLLDKGLARPWKE